VGLAREVLVVGLPREVLVVGLSREVLEVGLSREVQELAWFLGALCAESARLSTDVPLARQFGPKGRHVVKMGVELDPESDSIPSTP